MPTQINLDGVVPRGELALAREEHPDERAARLKKEANETTARLKQEGRAALIKDCQDVASFTVLYLFLIGMVVICVYLILFSATVPPETQRWSQSLLAAILSGTVSFIVGRKVGK